ncbi:MAG: hypothetical protein DMD65_02575 [Gemmatimonadetes bacterium]|nr:MAG: hypothetical protein DMD65_02575 [Gemmatimonadota bacterium]
MRHDDEHDAALRELAQRLGAQAAERLDVERTAQAVVARLKQQPRAARWRRLEPAWLRIAAAAMIVVAVGLVGRSISRASSLRQVAGFVEPAGGDLNDLSAAQLQELLQTVEQGGADQGGEAVSAQDVGLEDLSTSELRALLQSLEG